jgi:Flp pilus assembly protein TadG
MFSLFRRITAGKEHGHALVEFAIVLLPFMMLVFGLIRFAIFTNNWVTLNNSVEYAAQRLARNRCDIPTGCPATNYCTAAVTALDNAATTLNTTQITTNLSTLSPTPFPSPDSSTCTNLVGGDAATVQATYPCNLQILFLNPWPSCQFTVQTTIRIE